MRILYSLVTCGFLLNSASFASSKYEDELIFDLGMTNVTYAENASSIAAEEDSESTATTESEETEELASGGASILSLGLVYKFYNTDSMSGYLKATAPFLGAVGASYFSAGAGLRFYISSVSSKMTYDNNGTSISIIPKMRFFYGVESGIGFLVYETETAQKSDILLEIGGLLGMDYSFGKKMGLEIKAIGGQGVGTVTTNTVVKVFAGLTYFI